MRVEHGEFHYLIADQPGAAFYRLGDQPLEFGVGLCARDEEAAGLMQRIQALEIQVAAIHDVEGPPARQRADRGR